MKTVYKVLQTMLFVSLIAFVITGCGKVKDAANEIINDDDDDDEEFVDLGLPSGTLWGYANEADYYTYEEAVDAFGDWLPTMDQFYELIEECDWEWDEDGYYVTGPNGNYIFLEAEGKLDYEGHLTSYGVMGFYWSSTEKNDNYSYHLQFSGGALSEDYTVTHSMNINQLSVRLVQ